MLLSLPGEVCPHAAALLIKGNFAQSPGCSRVLAQQAPWGSLLTSLTCGTLWYRQVKPAGALPDLYTGLKILGFWADE